MVDKRDYKLTVMLSTDEERMLQEIADRRGLTASDWVRQAIRSGHETKVVAPQRQTGFQRPTPGQLRERVRQQETGKKPR